MEVVAANPPGLKGLVYTRLRREKARERACRKTKLRKVNVKAQANVSPFDGYLTGVSLIARYGHKGPMNYNILGVGLDWLI